MVWGLSGGGERAGAKITVRPGCIKGNETQFPFCSRHRKAFNRLWLFFWINKRLRKQAPKQIVILVFLSPPPAAQVTICLDSCSTCRCWHRLNKYLHIAFMYPFTSRSINIYSWVKCKLLQSSNANSLGRCKRGASRTAALYVTLSSFIGFKAAENRTYHGIHYSFSTSEVTGNTHKPLWHKKRAETLCWFMLGRNKLKSWCNYWFTSFNHMQRPSIDLPDSGKLMTVLITTRYWFLSLLYNTYAQSWTSAVHNYTFWSHPSKLQGFDPMPQRLVLNLS